MSLEDKFNAAVNVIRSLPKSGSYQPSNELMLRFYSYYKQATEGPCDKPKPGFWDVVNRAKWESWNKLGNMTKDEAMQAYVDELHKILETMSYNQDVASFLSVDNKGHPDGMKSCFFNMLSLSKCFPTFKRFSTLLTFMQTPDFNEGAMLANENIVETMSYNQDVASFLSVDEDDQAFPNNDLELVAGDVLRRVRSGQNSPVCSVSGASSPVRGPSPPPPRQRHDSEDEYIDTVDPQDSDDEFIDAGAVSISEPEVPPQRERRESSQRQNAQRLSNGHAHQITSQLTHLKVLEQLPGTLARLEADVAALRKAVEGDRRILDQVSRGWRWPWQELSAPTLALLIIWPFIAYRIASRGKRHT